MILSGLSRIDVPGGDAVAIPEVGDVHPTGFRSGPQFGRLADRIDALGAGENTLFIFTADNGTHKSITSRLNGREIRGGKSRPIQAGMHVPLVATMPGTIPAGEVCDDLVDFADIMPTLAGFTGARLPEDEPLDGVSFAPQLRGQRGAPHDWLFCYYWPRPITGPDRLPEVRFAYDKQWKLYSDGRLIHWARDPREKDPVRQGEGSSEARAAWKKLQQALDSMPAEPQAALRPADLEP